MEIKPEIIEIWHNPKCSKSREALQLLKDENCHVEVREYLKDAPTKAVLIDLLKKLGIKAHELIRTGEEIYKTTFKGKELNEEEWIQAMVDYPKLIERPIVIQGKKAIIGRPPSLVLELL